MRIDRSRWNETHQDVFLVPVAFLNGRLKSIQTIDWALGLKPDDVVKRAAVLHHLTSEEGRKLAEPWLSAWRLIEEYWALPHPGPYDDARRYDLGRRIKAGDRSGAIQAEIVRYVAPRIRLSVLARSHGETRKPIKKPRNVAQLLSPGLTSGLAVNPEVMGLHDVNDENFLSALAEALESSLTNGLNIARRLGWDGERNLHKLGQLYRAYYVFDPKRKLPDHEPDEFHRGIAPCVKLLHFVVERLAKLHSSESKRIVARWQLTPTPFHARLWATMARDPWIAPVLEVSNFLNQLGDHPFWDVQNFPEIAELRAIRFHDLTPTMQQSIAKRIMRQPPRSEWPRETDPIRLGRARLYLSLSELERIKLAGVLPPCARDWYESKLGNFPELAQSSRLDNGFMVTHWATIVSPNPDAAYDALEGGARLSRLESAFGTANRGWDTDVSEQALNWMRQTGNSSKILSDLEASASGGTAFPLIWDRFGWFRPSDRATGMSAQPKDELSETKRVLVLMNQLSIETVRKAIHGLCEWMSNKEVFIVRLDEGLRQLLRLWPIAVDATNSSRPAGADFDLSLIMRQPGDRESMDLDTLNTPVGKCVGVFLAACPTVKNGLNPFHHNEVVREMRDTIIKANGRSGLIVRYRLIEGLPYFLRADPDWASYYLIDPLLAIEDGSVSLWRALARRTQFADVLKIIGTALMKRTADLRLDRKSRGSLACSIVFECLDALSTKRQPVVELAEVSQMIRALDDEVRASCASAIGQFIQEWSAPSGNEEPRQTMEQLFFGAAAPFLRDVWPQERSLSTPGLSKALADLPTTSGNAFAACVDTIERFLLPFDAWSLFDYGLSEDQKHATSIRQIDNAVKATALLNLLSLTIGTNSSAVIPFDLSVGLAQIQSVAPSLVNDPKFRRLAAAARR